MTTLSDEAPVEESQEFDGSPKTPQNTKRNSVIPQEEARLSASPAPETERTLSSATTKTIAVPEEQQDIEADDGATLVGRAEDDDANIANEDDISSTISLKSNATSFKYENGRRYHAQADAQYFLPNDDMENDRLDLLHHYLTLRCDDRLHFAPIGSEPNRILDLGTGTGIWAIQMGDAYPSATIVGNDLSPVQPNVVPPNVTFEIDDIEAEWCFSRPFDYIHSRYLAGAITDWPRLIKQAFKYTKPGGWVEFQDFDMRFYSSDGTFIPGCATDEWAKEIVLGLKIMDFEPEPGPKLEKWVTDAGFQNVNHQCLPIPVGIWPKDKRMKEIGACDLSMFLEGLEAMSLRCLTIGRSWSREEVLGFLPAVRRDLKNKCVHAMHNFHVVWAQKPMSTVTT